MNFHYEQGYHNGYVHGIGRAKEILENTHPREIDEALAAAGRRAQKERREFMENAIREGKIK